MKTYYDELGIGREANATEIKRRYRALALKRHPDAAGGSTEAFVRLQEAYQCLSSPLKRRDYDVSLARRVVTAPPRQSSSRSPVYAAPVYAAPSAPATETGSMAKTIFTVLGLLIVTLVVRAAWFMMQPVTQATTTSTPITVSPTNSSPGITNVDPSTSTNDSTDSTGATDNSTGTTDSIDTPSTDSASGLAQPVTPRRQRYGY